MCLSVPKRIKIINGLWNIFPFLRWAQKNLFFIVIFVDDFWHYSKWAQQTYTCSKLTKEATEEDVKYTQSYQ